MVIHIFLHILSKNCICGYHLKVHSSRKSSEASVQEQHHDDGVMSNDVTSEMVIEYPLSSVQKYAISEYLDLHLAAFILQIQMISGLSLAFSPRSTLTRYSEVGPSFLDPSDALRELFLCPLDSTVLWDAQNLEVPET